MPSFRDLIRQTIAVYERLPEARTKAEKQKIEKVGLKAWGTATGMLFNNLKFIMKAHHAIVDVNNAIHDNKPIDALVPAVLAELNALLDPSLKVPDRPMLHAAIKEALGLMEQDEAKAWRKAYNTLRDARPYAAADGDNVALATVIADVAFVMGAYDDPSKWANPMFVEEKKDALRTTAQLLRATKLASEALMENPTTLPEWKQYIRSLSGPSLLSKALAANQVGFVRSLEADGLTPAEIATVFRGFAVRLVEDDQAVPSRVEGSYVDYGALAYPTNLNVESVPE